jgi:hypothetical protein
MIVNRLGPQVLETQWAGAGTFKRLLQSMGDPGLEITTHPEPGYVFDPRRHAHPARARFVQDGQKPPGEGESGSETRRTGEVVRPESGSYPENESSERYNEDDLHEEEEYSEPMPTLDEVIRRVSRVTGAPDLSPQQYAQAFRGIIVELQKIAAGEKTYNTYQSSKSVSEWCSEQGTAVARGDLVLIFKGIIYQDGIRFAKRPGSYTVCDLANVVLSNIKALCRRSRLELTENEEALLDQRILCGLEEPASSPVIDTLEKQKVTSQ